MPVSNAKRPVKSTDDKTLHPTKGYRKTSLKAGRASVLVQAIKRGGSMDLNSLRRFLNHGIA